MNYDRRRSIRVQKEVFFNIVSESLFEQRSVDISSHGILMTSNKPFDVGRNFLLDIIVPDESTIKCEAQVVWIYPRGRGLSPYKIGLEFRELSAKDEERLKNFIY